MVAPDLLVDAEDRRFSSWCRYINHDASPNCAAKTLAKGIGGLPRVWIVATRDIAPNEEICFKYADGAIGHWDAQ